MGANVSEEHTAYIFKFQAASNLSPTRLLKHVTAKYQECINPWKVRLPRIIFKYSDRTAQ